MKTYWTLEYAGEEKTLGEWGFSDEGLSAQFGNMVVDTFRVQMPVGDITGEEVIPYEGAVIVRSGRGSNTGGTNDFMGGAVEFQGKRLLHVLEGRPEFEGVVYQFGGPWYDIDATAYQQEYLQFTGQPPMLAIALASDVILFQKVDTALQAVRITTGEMITRILTYCLSVVPSGEAVPFAIGTIEPDTYLATYQAQDLKCSEAIHHCMRSSPDCAVQFDYTTIPPTLNIQKRANLGARSVTFGDGATHESISLTPRYDLLPTSVVVRFKQTNQQNAATIVTTITQKYGPHGLNSSLDPDGGRGVIVQTVDLEGYAVTTVTGKLDCVPFTDDRTWWQSHFADLKTTRTRRFRIGPQTYTDPDTGTAVTLAATTIKDQDGYDVDPALYPNQLRDGAAIATWMKLSDGTPITGVKVTITGEISCVQYDVEASGDPETSTNGRLLSKYLRKQVEAHVVLTNGVTGSYSSVSSSMDAEPIPNGMAQSIYEALSVLQYQGSFSVVEQECALAVRPGDALNITNGRSEWATMKALVQQVAKDYGRGRTVLTVGPAAHLSAGDLTQMFLINRHRRQWKNPATQASGLGSNQSGTSALGDKSPAQNSLPGLRETSQKKVVAPTTVAGEKTEVHHDAEGQQIALRVTNASGVAQASRGSITCALADTLGSDGTRHEVKLREVCVTVAGVNKTILVLGSDAY